jgi:hypothetical protein
LASCPWHEALFYAKLAPQIPAFNVSKLYLVLIDKDLAQQFIVMECIKDVIKGGDILMANMMGTNLEELGGPNCNLENVLK